jgi:hypothetical protein
MLIVKDCPLKSNHVFARRRDLRPHNLFGCLLLLALAGCPRGQQKQEAAKTSGEAAKPSASVTLRVLVVNEPGMAEAINRLRGEWAERSGGTLSASATTWADLATMKELDADAIVFPSRYLGELCTRDWLRPVRSSVLESPELNAADIFSLVRQTLMKWGGQTMALPLGVTMPNSAGADQHLSIDLLNQAAPEVLSNEREGVLFDSRTMKPQIASQVFVDAMPAILKRRYKEWATTRDGQIIPVIGYADKLVAVTASSHNAASAFKLITWLATAEISSQLATTGDRAMPVRKSLASSAAWYEPGTAVGTRQDLGKQLTEALSGHECIVVPRIPGVDEYVAALDEAADAVVRGKMQTQAALEKAAQQWEKITDSRGRDKQREAYLKHLGISGN